jgi:hypothetical protein
VAQAAARDQERVRREAALVGQLAAGGLERRGLEQALQREGRQRQQVASQRERGLQEQLAGSELALREGLGWAERERTEAQMRGDQAAAAAAAARAELLETTRRFARELAQLKAQLVDKDAQLVAAGLPLGDAGLLGAAASCRLLVPAAGGGRLQPLPAAAAAWEGGAAGRGGSAGPRMDGARAAALAPLALAPRVSSSADGPRGQAQVVLLGGGPAPAQQQGGQRRASAAAAEAVRRRSLTNVPEDAAPAAVPQRDSRGWSPGSLI